jgi:PhnB protein
MVDPKDMKYFDTYNILSAMEKERAGVKPIPDGYHTATPYLIVSDAAKAIDFYKRAFGATELMRMDAPNGRVAHAEIKIGNSILMLGEENPKVGIRGPQALGGTPMFLYLYVEDCDRTFDRAVEAGASAVNSLKDQMWGDRSGSVKDPFGHSWWIATHKEDVSMDEIRRRMAA